MTAPGRMLTVPEALAIVIEAARPLPPRRTSLTSAAGQVLAEEVVADIDLPPFDKSVVDGFAVRSADLAGPGSVRLRVVEEIYAGQTPSRRVEPGEAAGIMTGAPLPDGADAVVMVEKTERPDPDHVVIPGPVALGQNRLVRGREMRAGEVVVPKGVMLDAAKLGVMASVGVSQVLIQPRPNVAVVATGDELVPFHETPGPGQIRNSNTILLATLAQEHGATVNAMPIAPDRPDALRDAFRSAIEADVVLISGGVSAGKRDLVPEALEALGITCLFHKVKVKPGKPLWFGVGPARDGRPPALVFGLPGNPVSGLVSVLLFVRPALAILSGLGTGEESPPTLPLAVPYNHADDRDTYRPARLIRAEHGAEPSIEPLTWAGSSDLRGVATSDGFAIFPAGERTYQRGDRIGFLSLHPSRFGLGQSYYSR
jgi:molybdopterin molybdotransferase